VSLLGYAARGRNAWWRYLIASVLALVLAIVIGVIIVLPLTLLRLTPPDLSQQISEPTRPTPFFVSIGVSFGLVLLGFVLAVRWVQGKRFVDIVGDWRWRLFGFGAVLWLALQMAAGLLDVVLAPGGIQFTASRATLTLALAAIPALAVQTFTEEFVFRGYITQGLLLGLRRPWLAALVSGAIFAAAHFANGGPQALNALMFGVATAYIAIRTGGIAFSLGMHLANNLMAAVIVVSSADVFRGAPGVFTQASAPQLVWLDAAAQAGVLVVVVLLLIRTPLARSLPSQELQRQLRQEHGK
jgi:membrane protease YdiL (CAAX protease family)